MLALSSCSARTCGLQPGASQREPLGKCRAQAPEGQAVAESPPPHSYSVWLLTFSSPGYLLLHKIPSCCLFLFLLPFCPRPFLSPSPPLTPPPPPFLSLLLLKYLHLSSHRSSCSIHPSPFSLLLLLHQNVPSFALSLLLQASHQCTAPNSSFIPFPKPVYMFLIFFREVKV